MADETWYTFGPVPVYDSRPGAADTIVQNGTGGKLVLVKDGAALPIRDLNGTPIDQITSNADGQSVMFLAQTLYGLVQFGDIVNPAWAVEVGGKLASQDQVLAAAQQAVAAAQDAVTAAQAGSGSGGGVTAVNDSSSTSTTAPLTAAATKTAIGGLLTSSSGIEQAQDIIGGMVAAAGGSYNDATGAITLPSGGSGGAVTNDATSTSTTVAMTAAAVAAKAAATLDAAKAYKDRDNQVRRMILPHTADVPGLKAPASSATADVLAAIDWNSALVRQARLDNPHAWLDLDRSQAWLMQAEWNEILDTTLPQNMPLRMTGRVALAAGNLAAKSDWNEYDPTSAPGKIKPKPAINLVRRASDPIAVTAIDYSLQVGPNLAPSGSFTQICSAFGFASGYNRFKAGQALFLESNDYYAWAFRANGANNVWKATWVPVAGVLITTTGYSLTALNSNLGLTGSNVLKSLERRTLVGATSGATITVQGDYSTTGQIVGDSVSGDFTPGGEQLKDQATQVVVGTYSGTTRVLMAGKLNTTYDGPIGGTGANAVPWIRIGTGGTVDISGLSIEAYGDPNATVAEWNRPDAVVVAGNVGGFRAEGITIRSGWGAGVRTESCYRVHVDIDAFALPNHALESPTVTDKAYGYVYCGMGASDMITGDIRASGARHCVTSRNSPGTYNLNARTGSASGDHSLCTNYWKYGPGMRNFVFTGRGDRMSGQAWDTHEGAEDGVFYKTVSIDPAGAAKAVTGPDGGVSRGFGIWWIDPYFDGVCNGVNDGGPGLDDGQINFGNGYINGVHGGVMKNLQGAGLTSSDPHVNSTGSVWWKGVDIRADASIPVTSLQTVGFVARGRVFIDDLTIGGVNYAMGRLVSNTTPGKAGLAPNGTSNAEDIGNNSGRVVLGDMTYDWSNAAALSCIRLEAEFAALDMLGAVLHTNPGGAARPGSVVRAFANGNILNGQTQRGNATPIRYRGIVPLSLSSNAATPVLLINETQSGVLAVATKTLLPAIDEVGGGSFTPRSGVPTVAVTANAGSTATAVLEAGSTDRGGHITLTIPTGATGMAAGSVLTITYSGGGWATSAFAVVEKGSGGNTKSMYTSGQSKTGFSVVCPSALAANTVVELWYVVAGTD